MTTTTLQRLIPAIREVLRISDRQHDAWNEAKAALAEFEAQPAAQAFSLAAVMEDAAIRYAGGHTVDFAQEAAAIANGQQQAGAVPANQCAAEEHGNVLVPLTLLEDASSAIGNFVSDHGWSDEDMQAMDNLDAFIAQHKAGASAKPQPKGTDAEAQEWNYVIECRDGFVPNVKGPFNKQFTESTLREFAAMRPSYLMVVRSTGWPEVQSGVEWIDMCGDKRRGRLAVQAPAPAPEVPAGMVLVPRAVLQRCRDTAMTWTMKARVPECGEFGGIAQDLDALLGDLPAPSPAVAHQPLTVEQILGALRSITNEPPVRLPPGWAGFARAIERAHGIGVSDVPVQHKGAQP